MADAIKERDPLRSIVLISASAALLVKLSLIEPSEDPNEDVIAFNLSCDLCATIPPELIYLINIYPQ